MAPTRERWAVATAVEQGQGDQVLGFFEAEGHAVQHPQLGVRRLDQGVAQVVEHGRFYADEVPLDLAPELDEGVDATALDPGQPLVEHGEGQHSLCPYGDPQLLFHQIGAVEPGVDLDDPGQLVG